jgi:D-alanyl-D-alanine carboxypeptidase/D-alanyl-D-alanine-endopeptidase (penicillin-binding protein 4)
VTPKGEVATRAPGSGQGIQWTLRQEGQALESDVGGHVPEGHPRLRFVRRVGDPRLNPGKALVHALEQAGVKVEGEVKLGGAEEKTRLTYISSAPLSSLLHRVGKFSDNFYAETLFKGLAADADALPATSTEGAKRVKRWLDEQKIPSGSLKILNGSGLFDANRLTAHSLVSVLGSVYSKPAIRSEFVAQLAIGGVDGTLQARFRGPRQRSRVRAKTGTLDNVDVLAGYVLRESGRAPIAFAFVVNGISRQHAEVRAQIDRAVASLLDE